MAGNVLSNWRPARIGSTDFCILNVVSDGSPKAAASVACRELVLQHFSRVLKYGPPVSMFCFEVAERLSCSTTSFSSSWSLCKPAQLARLLACQVFVIVCDIRIEANGSHCIRWDLFFVGREQFRDDGVFRTLQARVASDVATWSWPGSRDSRLLKLNSESASVVFSRGNHWW